MHMKYQIENELLQNNAQPYTFTAFTVYANQSLFNDH